MPFSHKNKKKTALPSYLSFLLDKWSRSVTIPAIAAVDARIIMALLIKNHLFIQTTATKIATMATTIINAVILMAITIINAAIFMATAIINAAIFLKKFFIFFSLSLFNTAVFFNCKNFVSNLTCHFPTKTKTLPQGLHPSDRIFNKERNFDGESVLCTGKTSLPHLLYIVYQIFRYMQIFFGFFCKTKAPDSSGAKCIFQAKSFSFSSITSFAYSSSSASASR